MHAIFWLEKLKGRRDRGRPRCRWEDNIRIGLTRNRVRRFGLDSSVPG
jgi:hypothetical protein